MRAILLLATRIIASSVIGCALTGTVHAATLKPTSLKTSSVVGDDKVWRVTDDKTTVMDLYAEMTEQI
jgi:hypothetical protein